MAIFVALRSIPSADINDEIVTTPTSCNVSLRMLEDFGDYTNLMAEESSAIVLLTPHDDERTRNALEAAIKSVAPCSSKVWVALLSETLKRKFSEILNGKRAVMWGPRSPEDPLTEPHKSFKRDSWLGEVAKAVRGLDVPYVRNSKSTWDPAKIRSEKTVPLPRVPPLDPDGTRPIERRASLSPDEFLSYALWSVPVIVTDATADWGCMNWTFAHVKSNYPFFLASNQYVMGSGDDDDPNVSEPNAWGNPYFLREAGASIDKGMLYVGKRKSITTAHNDESCDQSIHATIAGAKHWRLYLGDVLERKLRRMQSKGYEGIPHSSKDAPWVGTVYPGEALVFNHVMTHDVRYNGNPEEWKGYNLGVSFLFKPVQPLFFHDAFWGELFRMQNGKYSMCRRIWERNRADRSQGL